MFVLKLLVKTVRLLNSETSSTAIALAVVFGMFLGLVPFFTLQAVLALAIVLFCRVNLSVTLFTFGLFKLAALALGPALDGIGAGLLETESLQGLWAGLYNSPLHFCRTHNSIALASTLAALVLAAPVFLIAKILVDAYRDRLNEWWTGLGFVSAFRGSKLYRLYCWLDSPVGE